MGALGSPRRPRLRQKQRVMRIGLVVNREIGVMSFGIRSVSRRRFAVVVAALLGLIIVGIQGAQAQIPKSITVDGLHVGTEVLTEHPACPMILRTAPTLIELRMSRREIRGRVDKRYVVGRGQLRMRFSSDPNPLYLELRRFYAGLYHWNRRFSNRCARPPEGQNTRCLSSSMWFSGEPLGDTFLKLYLKREDERRLRLILRVEGLISVTEETDEFGNTYTRRNYASCWKHRFAVLTD